MVCANHNNLVLPIDQYVEMTTDLTHILVDMYGLDGSLETVVDEHGNESYTEESQERFDCFNGEAEQILSALGFSREEDEGEE